MFFDLFAQAGGNSVRTAKLLREMLEGWPESAQLAPAEILLAEQEGDRITHDIVQRVNSNFVTPIDSEDIYRLAGKVDDIVDHIEEIADFMGLYNIEAPMDQSLAMADVIVKACEQLAMLLEHLGGFKHLERCTGSRSTGSSTTAIGSSARASPRCSSAGSTRCW